MNVKNQCLSVCLFIVLYCKGQVNLIPNWSFENGNGSAVPQCYEHYSDESQFTCGNICDFDDDLADWSRADRHPSCIGEDCGSPNWMDKDQCVPHCFPDTFQYPSQRYVYFSDADNEGIRVGFWKDNSSYILKRSRTYTLNLMLRMHGAQENELHVYFTKFNEHWFSSSNNNQKFKASTIIMNSSDYTGCRWYQITTNITIPSQYDELGNIVFSVEKGTFGIDDVELFLSPTAADCCPDFKLYEATQNLPTETHVEDYIKAGNDAGIPNVSGDVIVQSGQNITFKAGNYIELLPGFSTEAGATFTAEIEECNNVTNPSGGVITIVQFPNTFGGIGELSELWISANNATQYHATIFNRWGNRIFEVTGDILSDPFWIWHGTGACGPDDYFVILELLNCDNSFSQGQTVRYNGGSMCKTGTGSAEDSVETLDTLSIPEPLTLTSTQTQQPAFNIYPNPYQGSAPLTVQSDKLYIDITGKDAAQVLIVVVDMLGIERYSKVFVLPALNGTKAKDAQYTLAIDPDGKLPAGVYMVIAASDNELYRKKIVIQ